MMDLAILEREATETIGELQRQIAALTVADAGQAQQADSLRQMVMTRRRKVEEWFADPIDDAYRAHRGLCWRRTAALAPFLAAEQTINDKLIAWREMEDGRRREAEAAARAAAEAEAERQRFAEAEAALDAGDDERAEALLDVAVPSVVAPPPAIEPTPRLAATGFTEFWHAEVFDFTALVRAVAEGRAPADCIEPSTTALNRYAMALRGALAFPGVRAIKQMRVRSRARVRNASA